MTGDQLERALHDLFEGQLEGEALARLNRELHDNPVARDAYRETQLLHHCLRYRSKGTDLTKVIPMDRIIQRRQRRAMRHALLASAAVLVLGLLTLMLIMARPHSPTLSFTATPGAEVSLSHELVEGSETPEGRGMEPGSRMELGQGCVELEFQSGVKAVIQGPAELTLEREDLLRIDRGVAWFDVPPGAIGFQVMTQDLVLTDLGTRFGVVSRAGDEDQVHVFEGKVEVLNRGPSKAGELLTAGQARSAKPDGNWQAIQLDRDPFLTELPTTFSAPVQVVDSATFTSSPNNEMVRGPYLFQANADLRGFHAEGAKKLVVTLSHENGKIEGVSYEGLRLKRAAFAQSNGLSTAIYYLDSPPATGNLEIRTSGKCNGVGGSILALANAHRGKPAFIATETGSSVSLRIQSSNSLVIASLVANENQSGKPTSTAKPLSALFDGSCGSSSGASAYGLVARPQSLTASFKTRGASPAIAVVVIPPSP